MSQPPRRSRGFRQAAGLVAEPIRHAAEGRGFAVARLLTHWPEIVGAEIASRARPVKIGQNRRGFGSVLTLLCTGANAPLLEMQLPAIRDKVNACYGYNAISRITLTQTAPTGFADGQAEFTYRSNPAVKPDPETRRAAHALAAGISDPSLQAAVTRLATLKLAREGRNNRKAR
ncbi:DUF721 domain-containing protein [Paracoccus aerodenitrificans]|uniref:DUF721 domain-containing protein n=1 Tax=Paracoccus aerodenitrificans TaxID=3017781 RepID=UPI0022F0685C|nr:DUF721 domain-containing protein [Paracoccus aerodenitrificans]WBU63680.1 DUF721 domain-containing protein [Paracoccus aerodenitrificans]